MFRSPRFRLALLPAASRSVQVSRRIDAVVTRRSFPRALYPCRQLRLLGRTGAFRIGLRSCSPSFLRRCRLAIGLTNSLAYLVVVPSRSIGLSAAAHSVVL